MFRRPHFWGPPHMHPPPMPFGPPMIKEMAKMVFLWTIDEQKDGITGYDLQKNYQIKQTNVYRILKEMEDEALITSTEKIVNGRAQKLYLITNQGKKHLSELRENWTRRVDFLTDIAQPEHHRPPPLDFYREDEPLEELKDITKEELLENLEESREYLLRRKSRLEKRLNSLNDRLSELDILLNEIKELEEFDREKIASLLSRIYSRNR